MAAIATAIIFASCTKVINTVNDPHFDKKGFALDSLRASFQAQAPSALGFYVEVSGSMNGFFRSNQDTRFKKDVWSIVSNFGENDVAVLSNEGTVAGKYAVQDFRSRMNRGAFVSNQETMVPKKKLKLKSNPIAFIIFLAIVGGLFVVEYRLRQWPMCCSYFRHEI